MTDPYRKMAEEALENWQHYDFSEQFIDMFSQCIRIASERAYKGAILDVLKELSEVSIYSSKESDFYNKIVKAIRLLRKPEGMA